MSEENATAATGDAAREESPSAKMQVPADPSAVGDSLSDWWSKLPVVALRTALAIDGLFVLLYFLAVVFAPNNPNVVLLVGLEQEGNLPSWWFGAQQLLVAIVFFVLASRLFASDQRLRPIRPLLMASAFGFGFISFDEVGEFHEIGSRILMSVPTISHFVQHAYVAVHIKHRFAGGGGVWIPIYAVIGVVALVWLVPRAVKAYRIWPKQVTTVAWGFGLFAFSAAILQVVGYFTKAGTLAHYVYVIVEQAVKMVGISIALFGALQVLAIAGDALTRRLGAASDG